MAVVARADRVVLAGWAGEIVVCELDAVHINLAQILGGNGFGITQVTWMNQLPVAGNGAGGVHIWVSPVSGRALAVSWDYLYR
jgi:hypothetical protein